MKFEDCFEDVKSHVSVVFHRYKMKFDGPFESHTANEDILRHRSFVPKCETQ